MLVNELFENTLKKFNIGFWEINSLSPLDIWSKAFINNLGYEVENLVQTTDYFIQYLVHPKDAAFFKKNYQNYKINNISFRQSLKVKNVHNDYLNFICYTVEELLLNIKTDTKLLFFQPLGIDVFSDEDVNFRYQEAVMMSSTGSWFVDFQKKKSCWDTETKKILGFPANYEPSLKDSWKYYYEDDLQLASNLFLSCSTTGKPFNSEIRMNTYNGNVIWIKCVGKPVFNSSEVIIGLKGIIQNIDESKRRELKLQRSIDTIASQNNQLFNFAHIVSHNLRSHSSNLSLLVQLIDNIDNSNEKLELVSEVKNISKNLSTTIEHLNDIVTIHTNKKQKRKNVSFKETLELVLTSIRNIIASGNAKVTYNFESFPSVRFIPAYMESILLNLVTNAIKYKHPNRDAQIHFESGIHIDGKGFLRITDNGQGIDLEKYGNKIFGMYKTFHTNTDAVGIGLFITKNQIEAQNGTITVDSTVGQGTVFTIHFS